MPPLPSIVVPAVDRPGKSVLKPTLAQRGISSGQRSPSSETGAKNSLPIGVSDYSPQTAVIVDRFDFGRGPLYQLTIGESKLDGIGLAEILDYVSPLQLELFENAKFVEERNILKVAEEDDRRQKEDEHFNKIVARKQKAKKKGVVIYELRDETDESPAELGSTDTSRGRRPRPTYTHLYNIFKSRERRRRKRDPETGELLALSGDDEAPWSSEDDETPSVDAAPRRRRRRDPITGELRPPPPFVEEIPPSMRSSGFKRGRRRRHPITRELMPLGWKFNQDEGETSTDGPEAHTEPASFERLSIAEEPVAKRLRLEAQSNKISPSPAPEQYFQAAASRRQTNQGLGNPSKMIISSTDPDSNGGPDEPHMKAMRATNALKGSVFSPLTMLHLPQTQESPNEPGILSRPLQASTSITKPSASETKTSILNPSATRASPSDLPLAAANAGEQSDESMGEDFDIEAILQHGISDPKTHPSDLGSKPVMLYLVKWVGFSEPTWEPLESFGDLTYVDEYHRRKGLQPLSTASDTEQRSEGARPIMPGSGAVGTVMQPEESPVVSSHHIDNPGDPRNDDAKQDVEDEDSEESEYEIEGILSHHLSDPRTHGAQHGQEPVMLYQVQWKGYGQPTWEPAESFEGAEVFRIYRRKNGLE